MRIEYKILLTAGLLANLGDNLIGPFYAIWVRKITEDPLIIGNSIAFYSLLAGILIIVFGKLADKYNKELLAMLGYLLSFIGTILYLIITQPWHLYAQQVLFAFSAIMLAGPLKALFSEFINKEKAGFQWALGDAGNKIIIAFAIFSGSLVVKLFGFTNLFIIMALLQLVAVILQFDLYRRSWN